MRVLTRSRPKAFWNSSKAGSSTFITDTSVFEPLDTVTQNWGHLHDPAVTANTDLDGGLDGYYVVFHSKKHNGSGAGSFDPYFDCHGVTGAWSSAPSNNYFMTEGHSRVSQDHWRTLGVAVRCMAGETIQPWMNQFNGSNKAMMEHTVSAFRVAYRPDMPPIGALAKRTNSLSLTNNTNTVLSMESEVWDDGGMCDIAGNPTRLTCPSGGDGWYLIGCASEFATNNTGNRRSYFNFNGTAADVWAAAITRSQSGSGTKSPHAFGLIPMVAGDYVESWSYQNSGGAFSISQINMPPAVFWAARIALFEVGAYIYRSTTQTINAGATTAISFDTEVRDDGGVADLAGQPTRLTAPVDGIYCITGLLWWTANTATPYRKASLRIDGTTLIAQTSSNTDTGCQDPALCVGAAIQLNAGQYVELLATNPSASNITIQANRARMGMVRVDGLTP